MLTKQDLITFLKENNAFEAFKRNSTEFGSSLPNLWDNLEKLGLGFKDIISLAFPWDKTPEQAVYWLEIDRKWTDFIEKKPETPVYDPVYSQIEVARVYAPKLTRENRDNLEKLLKEKHPEIIDCKKTGEYLIGYVIKITGLTKRI